MTIRHKINVTRKSRVSGTQFVSLLGTHLGLSIGGSFLGGDTSCVFGGPTCDGGVFLGGYLPPTKHLKDPYYYLKQKSYPYYHIYHYL
jgi:hypothetical protein